MYTFKSNFNLRTFPFDKQRIKIHLVNNKHDYFDFRSKVSSDSMKEAYYLRKKIQLKVGTLQMWTLCMNMITIIMFNNSMMVCL